MKRISLTLLYVIFGITSIFGQQDEIDSLKHQFEIETDIDEKAWILLDIGHKFLEQYKFDSSEFYFDESLKLYKSTNNKNGISSVYAEYGLLQDYSNNQDSALKLYDIVLKLKKEIKDTLNVAIVSQNIGAIYYDKGNYEKALLYYNEALGFFDKLHDTLNQADVLNNIGMVYRNLDSNKRAVEFYFKSIEMLDAMDELYSIQTMNVYNNLGNLYLYQDQYAKALENYEKIKNISIKNKSNYGIAYANLNIGNVYLEKGDYEKARIVLEEVLKISNENNFPNKFVGNLHRNLAKTYLELNEIDLALENIQIAIPLLETLKELDLASTLNVLAEIYLQKKEFNKSEEILKRILTLEERMSTKATTYNLLMNLYEEKADYKKAYYYQTLSWELSDSASRSLNDKKILQMQIELETAEKERENERLELENQLQKNENLRIKSQNSLIILSAIFIVLLLILFFIVNQKNQKNKLDKLLLEDIDRQKDTISGDLHDGLSGYLHSLKNSMLTKKNKFDLNEELELIGRSQKELRFLLMQLNSPIYKEKNFDLLDELSDLLDFYETSSNFELTRHYVSSIEWQKISYRKKLQIYKLIQEMFANIRKHSDATEVNFQVVRDKKRLHVTIEDNGKGFDPEKKSQGYGLMNMHKRIKELKGDLQIDSSEGNGTFVSFSLSVF